MAETLTIQVIDDTRSGGSSPTLPGLPSIPVLPGGSGATAPGSPGGGGGGFGTELGDAAFVRALATGNVGRILASIRSGVVGFLGPVGIAATAAAGAFTAVALSVRKFGKIVEDQVSNLVGLSGPVAAAQAQTEVDRLNAQIRRANRIGPELAQAERLRSRFESTMTDLGTEILAILLEMLDAFRPFAELILAFLEKVVDLVENKTEGISQLLLQIVTAGIFQPPLIDAIKRFLRRGEEDEDAENDPFNQQFEALLADARRQTDLDRAIVAGGDVVPVGA